MSPSRRIHSPAFKVKLVEEALALPAACRIKPTCRKYPGVEPTQLRKWIKVYRSGAPQPPGVGVNAPDLYVLNHGVLNQGGWAVIAKLHDVVNATLLHNAAVPPSRGVPIGGWCSVPSPPLLAYTALPIMTCYGW